jgi:hypothetical protein
LKPLSPIARRVGIEIILNELANEFARIAAILCGNLGQFGQELRAEIYFHEPKRFGEIVSLKSSSD